MFGGVGRVGLKQKGTSSEEYLCQQYNVTPGGLLQVHRSKKYSVQDLLRLRWVRSFAQDVEMTKRFTTKIMAFQMSILLRLVLVAEKVMDNLMSFYTRRHRRSLHLRLHS
jgi:hypothetical protein